MAKATQPRDIVPTRVAALSPSYFDGVPSRVKLEEIEDRSLSALAGTQRWEARRVAQADRGEQARADREHVARAESFRKQPKMTQTGASEKMNRPALRGDDAMATAKQAVSKMFEGTTLHHASIFRKAIRQAKEENDRGNVINAINSLRNHLPLGLKEAKDLNDLIRQAVDYEPANGYDWIAYV
jgi:hypothetical protein